MTQATAPTVVIVKVVPMAPTPGKVLVTIQDSKGATLQQQVVTTAGGQPVTHQLADVHGKDNLVVVTQAQEGDATVDMSAQSSVQATLSPSPTLPLPNSPASTTSPASPSPSPSH